MFHKFSNQVIPLIFKFSITDIQKLISKFIKSFASDFTYIFLLMYIKNNIDISSHMCFFVHIYKMTSDFWMKLFLVHSQQNIGSIIILILFYLEKNSSITVTLRNLFMLQACNENNRFDARVKTMEGVENLNI